MSIPRLTTVTSPVHPTPPSPKEKLFCFFFITSCSVSRICFQFNFSFLILQAACIVPTGYYVYVETSWYYNGHFAELLGPNLLPSSTCQVRFCYHMYGATMGTLNVYMRKSLDPRPDDTQQLIWTMSGDHGDRYIYWLSCFSKCSAHGNAHQ